jgi:hypothetical protein
MSEGTLVSRRSILTLAAGGVIGATAVSPPPAAAQGEDFLAKIVATAPRAIFENSPLLVTVRCQVPANMVGQQYMLRVTMLTDTSEIRYKYDTNPAQITAANFEVQINNGSNRPVEDWNLIPERIHVMVASINVLHQAAFGLATDFAFKVLEV